MPNKIKYLGKIKDCNKILMKSKDRTCSNHLHINSSIDSTSSTQNSTKIIKTWLKVFQNTCQFV